jgi:hypothetical protein
MPAGRPAILTRIAQKDAQQVTEKAIKELTEDTVEQAAKEVIETFSREHSPLTLRTKNDQKTAKGKAGKAQKTGKGRKK